jgi:hypothetical protein
VFFLVTLVETKVLKKKKKLKCKKNVPGISPTTGQCPFRWVLFFLSLQTGEKFSTLKKENFSTAEKKRKAENCPLAYL